MEDTGAGVWPVGLKGRDEAEQRAYSREASLGISGGTGHRTPGAGTPEREGHGRREESCPNPGKCRPLREEGPWGDSWGVWAGGRRAGGAGEWPSGNRGEGAGAGERQQRCHMGVTSWCSRGPREVRPRCGLRRGAGAARGPCEGCREGAGRVRGTSRREARRRRHFMGTAETETQVSISAVS